MLAVFRNESGKARVHHELEHASRLHDVFGRWRAVRIGHYFLSGVAGWPMDYLNYLSFPTAGRIHGTASTTNVPHQGRDLATHGHGPPEKFGWRSR